jgi:glycosyltransferase involved in cell wall biosynthesis
MKVLHLAAGNRWTGAAAPAFAEVEALRGAGIDAHYAYVGGYKLQAKLAHHDFAHPLIEKAQNPFSFSRTVAKLEHMVEQHGFDIIHAHLTYDHWLARMLARGRPLVLARTFHARRVLRTDPFTRSLLARTPLSFVINDAFRKAPLLRERESVFTPPPLDHHQFSAEGPNARALYGIPANTNVVAAIGKLSRDRGFESALRTFALLREKIANTRLMIIGHGEHRAALEQLAQSLGIANDVTWAGYHEDDLAEHYRAANLLLFTARGSDEGHRAILEAMACGVPPASYPLEGVPALVGDSAHIAQSATADALATTAAALLAREREPLRTAMNERSREFRYARAAERLIVAYERAVAAASA